MPQVTVFTRSTCAPCRTVKYFLEKKGVSFIEKNIDEADNAQEFARFTTMPMVPLILVGDKMIQGLNIPLLSQALMV